MKRRIPTSRVGLPATLGVVAVSCALLGLLAFRGYGLFAMRGINAVIARDQVAVHHMAIYAGWFTSAQLVLGLLAIGLGWVARARGEGSRLAGGLGTSVLGLGILVLLLAFLLV